MNNKKSNKLAPAKTPVITSKAVAPVVRRNRDAVLLSTTPAKLSAQIGADTPILVSRKHLRNLLQKDSTAKLLAGLEA